MDPQSIPNQLIQPEQTNYQQQPFRLPLIIGIFFTMVIIGAGAHYLGSKQSSKQVISPTPISAPTATPTLTLTPTSTPTPNPISMNQPTQTLIIPNEITDWKTYTNQKLGITLKYPPDLFFKETDPNYGVKIAFESFPSPVPGQVIDSISVNIDNNALYSFNMLRQAKNEETGIDVHQACGVVITKIRDMSFGQYNAVEYIFDGSNPPSGCGRDLIGYEHTILIRKNDNEFIKLVNGSMDPNKTRQHDAIFNQIVSSLILQ